jgi:SAM-dependent methyltransferase
MNKIINSCRVCGHNLNNIILCLENMPLTDEFIGKDKDKREFLQDIYIFRCENCSLVQNPINFDYSEYYQDYEYSSGHSQFTRAFMSNYAKYVMDESKKILGRKVENVIEVGSGDGVQLKYFLDMGVQNVLGVEPSKSLVEQSEKLGVPALLDLFSIDIVGKVPDIKFDICISSYTLDHVPEPVDFLKTSNKLLSDNGILAFEVHDLSQIYSRSEWCLFEHEHTIYMDKEIATDLVERYGFKVLSVNPFNKNLVRANSLIIVAQKIMDLSNKILVSYSNNFPVYKNLDKNIYQTITEIDKWIYKISKDNRLIGWGVGGRGVMTLAAIKESDKFETIVDSNYDDQELLTPKTRIKISGVSELHKYSDCYCLVFSFGYYDEIKEVLLNFGFSDKKIISLDYFYQN